MTATNLLVPIEGVKVSHHFCVITFYFNVTFAPLHFLISNMRQILGDRHIQDTQGTSGINLYAM